MSYTVYVTNLDRHLSGMKLSQWLILHNSRLHGFYMSLTLSVSLPRMKQSSVHMVQIQSIRYQQKGLQKKKQPRYKYF